ncbi:mRNA export protein mlo3 [Erysiphe neolycopersici]|uniref:mRNA export protein mlo3 n=1 Tax=Erysiphe neolycopersici TaxID=212602 RepID=A0A420HD04_9PEZI|nr:mRNA export protein mlo3 [Erysiphe neolycopersici]
MILGTLILNGYTINLMTTIINSWSAAYPHQPTIFTLTRTVCSIITKNHHITNPFHFSDPQSAKLRVENLHYDLTEDDLDDLFNRIGPVKELSLTYDRAGRSEGIAYVTYEQSHHARRAIQEYDGANAKGQPIRLISIPLHPPARRRNPPPPRPRSIFDRVTIPARKSRYVPGRQTRSRSPQRYRREGRRIGDKSINGRGAERLAKDGRPKKTQEELDAEMDDYWNNKDSNNSLSVNPPQNEVMDEEMIE